MKKPTKRYILWLYNGSEGYVPTEHDSVGEALVVEKYTSDWYITESINDVTGYGSFKTPKEDKE